MQSRHEFHEFARMDRGLFPERGLQSASACSAFKTRGINSALHRASGLWLQTSGSRLPAPALRASASLRLCVSVAKLPFKTKNYQTNPFLKTKFTYHYNDL